VAYTLPADVEILYGEVINVDEYLDGEDLKSLKDEDDEKDDETVEDAGWEYGKIRTGVTIIN